MAGDPKPSITPDAVVRQTARRHDSKGVTRDMTAATGSELARLPLFASLGPDERDAAASLFLVRAYPQGAIVANEGDLVSHLAFVLSGRIRLFARDVDGHQVDVSYVVAGDPTLMSALVEKPLPISLMAAQPLVLLAIAKEDFESLLRRHPELAVRFARLQAGIVRELVANTKVLLNEDVYGRVAWWLSKRAQPVDGRLVTDRLTHEDIGRRVGATREMVGRVLRELAAGGYIAASDGRYTLLRKLPRHR